MNEENSYNLIDEPWIPVLMRDGTNRSVSLGTVFADTDGMIADLALNPYERVAVFRLLLCIAQAALSPERLKDEAGWLAAKDAIGPVSADYLKKWHDRFFLYGPHAFLQPDCIVLAKADGTTPCDKLIFQLASGNNSTLYDHEAVGGERALSNEKLALGLLSYECFSAGSTSSKCKWSGIETSQYIKAAPCREQSMLFTIVTGCSIIDTIWLNLLSDAWIRDSLKADLGRPFWEFNDLSRNAISGNEKTYLGHLVPFSRAIKLTRGSPTCILGEALSYPPIPAWREPMASVKLQKGTKKDEFTETYVSSNPARMPWRELASILAVRETGGRKSALALRHLESMPDRDFTLWTGGLYSKQAKEIDTIEWRAFLSVDLLEEPAMKRYEEAISWADKQENHLIAGVIGYSEELKMSKVKQDKIEVYPLTIVAQRTYWDILAQAGNQKLVLGVDSPTYKDDWRKATRKAAVDAYRRACPAMTARQMEAFAQGFSKLTIREES